MLLAQISSKTDLARNFEWMCADIDLNIQCLVLILKASVIVNSGFFVKWHQFSYRICWLLKTFYQVEVK